MGGTFTSVLSAEGGFGAQDLAKSAAKLGWEEDPDRPRVKIPRADHLLDAPLEDVGFDRPTLLKFDQNERRFTTLRDVIVLTESQLKGYAGMGNLAVQSIQTIALSHGFALGTDPRSLPPPVAAQFSNLGDYVDVLDLGRHALTRLRHHGILTLRDLVQFVPREVGQLGFNPEQVEAMRLALRAMGLAFRTRLDGEAGSDPEFLAHLKESGLRDAHGSLDLAPYLDRPISALPIARVTVHWLHYRGHRTVRDLLKKHIEDLPIHASRRSNVEAVLALFCPPLPF